MFSNFLKVAALSAFVLAFTLNAQAQFVDNAGLTADGFSTTEIVGTSEVSSVTGLAVDYRDRDAIFYFNGNDSTLRRYDFADATNVIVDTLSVTVFGTAIVTDPEQPDLVYLLHSGNFATPQERPTVIEYELDSTDRTSVVASDTLYVARDFSADTPPGPNLVGFSAYDAAFADSLGERRLVLSEGNGGNTDIVEIPKPNLGYNRAVLVTVPGASGSIAFDNDGNLYYAFPSDSSFTATNQVQIMTWNKSQLDNVRGGGLGLPLDETDGTIIRTFDATQGETPDWHTIPYMTARSESGDTVIYAGRYEGSFVGTAVSSSIMRLNITSGNDELDWQIPNLVDTVAGEAQSDDIWATPNKLVFTSTSGSFAGFEGQYDEVGGNPTAIMYGAYQAFGGAPTFPSESSLFQIRSTNEQSEIQEIALTGSGANTTINVLPDETFALNLELRDAGGSLVANDVGDASVTLSLVGSSETLNGYNGPVNANAGNLNLTGLSVTTPGSYTLRISVAGGASQDLTLTVATPHGTPVDDDSCSLQTGSSSGGAAFLAMLVVGLLTYRRREA